MSRETMLARIGRRRSLRYWQCAADALGQMPPDPMTDTVRQARALRGVIDRVLAVAEDRLMPPFAAASGAAVPGGRPDWRWRPEAVRAPLARPGRAAIANDTGLGQGLKIFHDCPAGEITLRQRRSTCGAGFDLWLEVYRFEGTFLSLVADVPPEGLEGLSRTHVVALTAGMTCERPMTVYARLNLRCGPNTETEVREVIPDGEGHVAVEFDLAHMGLDRMPIAAAWVDLLFEAPAMNAVALCDLTFAHRPGAQF